MASVRKQKGFKMHTKSMQNVCTLTYERGKVLTLAFLVRKVLYLCHGRKKESLPPKKLVTMFVNLMRHILYMIYASLL